MPRVMLSMTEDVRKALVAMARAQCRDPRAQGTLLLEDALARNGYLPGTSDKFTELEDRIKRIEEALDDGH